MSRNAARALLAAASGQVVIGLLLLPVGTVVGRVAGGILAVLGAAQVIVAAVMLRRAQR
jgi:hypothetical protein